jgi:hypothetical protein
MKSSPPDKKTTIYPYSGGKNICRRHIDCKAEDGWAHEYHEESFALPSYPRGHPPPEELIHEEQIYGLSSVESV